MTESQLRFVRDHSLDHSRGRVEQSDNEVRRKHSENHSSNHILGSMTIVELCMASSLQRLRFDFRE